MQAVHRAVIQELSDELVWHYPAMVLGTIGVRSADMALRLAEIVSRILALAPTYKHSRVPRFLRTKRYFNKTFIQKHVGLCTGLLDQPPSNLFHQEAPARVRAAMRTLIVAGGDRDYHRDDDSLIWCRRFKWDEIRGPQRVLFQSYLQYCLQEEDFVGLGDALLVTSGMRCFGRGAHKAAYLDILIFSLRTASVRSYCHANCTR